MHRRKERLAFRGRGVKEGRSHSGRAGVPARSWPGPADCRGGAVPGVRPDAARASGGCASCPRSRGSPRQHAPSRCLRATRRSTAWTSPSRISQLAAGCPSEQNRNAVPRTAVAGDRERHLRSPRSPPRKSPAEPFSEPEMSRISRRVTIGVRLQSDAQADRCRGARSLIEREFRELSTLDPAELGVGHIGGRAGRPLADRRVEAAGEEFRTEGQSGVRCATRRPWSAGSFRAGMPAILPAGPYVPLTAGRPQTHRTVRSSNGSSAVPLESGTGVWRSHETRHDPTERIKRGKASPSVPTTACAELAERAKQALRRALHRRPPDTQAGRRRMPAARGT